MERLWDLQLPALLSPDDGKWRNHAMCKGIGVDPFFANYFNGQARRETMTSIIAMCRVCPVRKECLRFAVDNKINDGIWGGLTAKERRSLCNGSNESV